jgi:hypothetical protein
MSAITPNYRLTRSENGLTASFRSYTSLPAPPKAAGSKRGRVGNPASGPMFRPIAASRSRPLVYIDGVDSENPFPILISKVLQGDGHNSYYVENPSV